MKKILVIGCPGSGKSVFSRCLSGILGIPVYHLDMVYWKPDVTEVPREVFDEKITEIMNRDEWIMDGNYGRTLSYRLGYADTVFYLDLPLEVCLQSIEDRIGTVRDDLPWVEETLDPEFREYVRQFPENQGVRVRKALNESRNVNIIRFTSRDEVNSYLDRLENDNRSI